MSCVWCCEMRRRGPRGDFEEEAGGQAMWKRQKGERQDFGESQRGEQGQVRPGGPGGPSAQSSHELCQSPAKVSCWMPRWWRQDAAGQLMEGECFQKVVQDRDRFKLAINLMDYYYIFKKDCGCEFCVDRNSPSCQRQKERRVAGRCGCGDRLRGCPWGRAGSRECKLEGGMPHPSARLQGCPCEIKDLRESQRKSWMPHPGARLT